MTIPKCSVCEDYHFPGDCEWKPFLREHDPEWEEPKVTILPPELNLSPGERIYPGKVITYFEHVFV